MPVILGPEDQKSKSRGFGTGWALVASKGGAGQGGPGIRTPPAPTKATCGNRPDPMSFFGQWGRE